MKIVIASDLHGSAKYTEELLSFYKNQSAEKLILLGDLLYHGPRNALPDGYDCKSTAELLNSFSDEIIAVRGNCDSEVDQMLLDFPMLSDYAVIFDGKTEMFATHGHIYNKDKLPPLKDETVLLNGHFHVNELSRNEKFFYVNPGSVSIPKRNMIRSCVVYENGMFVLYSLEDGKILEQMLL